MKKTSLDPVSSSHGIWNVAFIRMLLLYRMIQPSLSQYFAKSTLVQAMIFNLIMTCSQFVMSGFLSIY